MVVYIRNGGAPKARLQPLKIQLLRQGNWSAGPRQGICSLVANWMFSLLARNSFSVAVSNIERFLVELELDLDFAIRLEGRGCLSPLMVGRNFGSEGRKPWNLIHITFSLQARLHDAVSGSKLPKLASAWNIGSWVATGPSLSIDPCVWLSMRESFCIRQRG